jgi:hypothetical protein
LSIARKSAAKRDSVSSRSERSRDSVWCQPWFLPNKIAREIRKLVPRDHEQRMISYFAEHGCIKCDEKDALYAGNGFCIFCRTKLQKRLKSIAIQLSRALAPESYGMKFIRDAAQARRLLSGFPKNMYIKPDAKPGRKHGIDNPVRDAHIIVTQYPSERARDEGERKHVVRRQF